MSWMNEWDVRDSAVKFGKGDTPNLFDGAIILNKLMEFTNRNSDGWPYWNPPSNAAKSLMELLQKKDDRVRWTDSPVDVTEADIDRVVRPIKAFYTRVGNTPKYGASADTVREATIQKEWIAEYLKESRGSLARKLI